MYRFLYFFVLTPLATIHKLLDRNKKIFSDNTEVTYWHTRQSSTMNNANFHSQIKI